MGTYYRAVLEALSHPSGAVPLGQAAEFQLRSEPEEPAATATVWVESNGILSFRPLRKWKPPQASPLRFWYFPESPGRHVLRARLESKDGSTQNASYGFRVTDGGALDPQPSLSRIDTGAELWAPSTWEAEALRQHERALLARLQRYVSRGDVVYDVGANLGLFAIRFAALVGEQGHVYCIEPNPVCVHFLRANLVRRGLNWTTVLPVALSQGDGTVDFSVNFDNSNLGTSVESSFFDRKPGQHIIVEATSLDALMDRFALQRPACVKIDVEGAEARVARGMRRCLSESRPVVVMELHGLQAAEETISILDEMEYRYVDAVSGQRFQSALELLRGRPDAPFQIVAEPHE